MAAFIQVSSRQTNRKSKQTDRKRKFCFDCAIYCNVWLCVCSHNPTCPSSYIKDNTVRQPKLGGSLPNKERYDRQTAQLLQMFVRELLPVASRWDALVFWTRFGVLLGRLPRFPRRQIQKRAFHWGISLFCNPTVRLSTCCVQRNPHALAAVALWVIKDKHDVMT